MKNSILTYWNARKSLRLKDIPQRLANGNYSWCNSQRIILRKYDKNLRQIDRKVRQLNEQKSSMMSEIQIYESPAKELDRADVEEKKNLQRRLEETEFDLDQIREEKKQMEEDLANHGVEINKNSSPDKTKDTSRTYWWKHSVGSIAAIWLLFEGLFTGAQWGSLRDVLDIEEILIRSLEAGVLFLLFHIVSHLNKRNPQSIYSTYMKINIFLILIMIFVPPLLDHLYQVGDLAAVNTEWSLTDSQEAESNSNINDIPSWVVFYWNNHWIPAVIGFIYAIVVFSKAGLAEGEGLAKVNEKKESPDIDFYIQSADDFESEIKYSYRSLLKKENELQQTQAELTEKFQELDKSPGELAKILDTLESLQDNRVKIENEVEQLEAEGETLLNDLFQELDAFKNEFTRIVQNDNVHHSVINPAWPTKEDVHQYFNLKTIGGTK